MEEKRNSDEDSSSTNHRSPPLDSSQLVCTSSLTRLDSNVPMSPNIENLESAIETPPKKRKRRSNLTGISQRKLASQPKTKTAVKAKNVPDALLVVNTASKENRLHLAASKGHTDELKRLLVDSLTNAQLLRRDASGDTALHNAIINGNIACTMVMLNHPNIQVTNELGRELLAVCGPEMTTVRDFLERKVFQEYYLPEGESNDTFESMGDTAVLAEPEVVESSTEPMLVANDSTNIISDFDYIKTTIVNRLDKLRGLWDIKPELVIMLARYIELADEIGPDFLPLIMFGEAVQLKSAKLNKGKTPSISRTTSLYLAHGYRQLGNQFLTLQREMQYNVPREETLRAVGEKELDVPPRIVPGFIEPMLEEASKQYAGKKTILANDERKAPVEYGSGIRNAAHSSDV